MASIHALLGTAQSALTAQKTVMHVTGKNIANANTLGYSRQRTELSSTPMAGLSVTAGSVRAVRAMQIQQSLLGASQAAGYESGRVSVLQLAEPGLNDLDGGGVSAAIESFFAAASELAGNPVGIAEREQLLAKAASLGNSIRGAANSITVAQKAAETEAHLAVAEINQITTDIAQLNDSIALSQGTDSAEELVDQRNLLLEQLSGLTDIQTVAKDDGSVSVFMGSGRALVHGGTANTMELGGGGDDPLSIAVSTPDGKPVGSPPPPGGRLGGLIAARDETLATAANQLDELAHGLVSAVNAVHEAGFGQDGSTGISMFEPIADVKGAAAAMALSKDIMGKPEKLAASADETMLPGDDANIQALFQLHESGMLADGKTVTEGWDKVVATVATALNQATTQAKSQSERLGQFQAMAMSESGVSIAEEMTALTQAERAFEAASRVIQTVNDLYDTVLRMV